MRCISWGMTDAKLGPRIRRISATCAMPRSRNAATMISCVGSYIAIPFVSVPAKMLDRDYTHLSRGRGGNSCGVQLRASCTRAPSHGFCSLLGVKGFFCCEFVHDERNTTDGETGETHYVDLPVSRCLEHCHCTGPASP